MDEQSQPAVTPPTDTPAEPTTPVAAPDTPSEQPAPAPEPSVPETPVETAPAQETQEEAEYPNYQAPPLQPLDFSRLPVDENNLIDPSALAGAINNQMYGAVESARNAARQEYMEQRSEERSWEKAYEKYPDLKTNKDLRDLVNQARIGEATDILSRSNDPKAVKLPTPAQIADKFFKQIGTAKTEGMKQATENVKVQNSAYVETAGTKTNDGADNRSKLYQDLRNPNKLVAKQAGADLLKSMLFGNK